MLGYNLGFYDQWEDSIKVVFDGENRIIYINSGETEIDVKEDIYSAWKRWAARVDNAKWYSALRSVGGDITPTGFVGDTYFLINGWRIKAREANGGGNIRLTGILYTEEGDSPVIPVSGMSFEYTVSNLASGVVSVQEVVNEVVSEAVLDADTLTLLTNAYLEAKKARQLQSNKAVISNEEKLVTIYDDDGTTILHQFDVTTDRYVRAPR